MALNDAIRYPPEPFITGAHSLVRNGLMQTDLDANHYRIINLDTSNLVLDEIPTQGAQPHKWFNSYDMGTHSFGVTQPGFADISGQLSLTQQRAITRLGRIVEGQWLGTVIEPDKVPTLDAIRVPVQPVDVNNKRITVVADPFEDQDATNMRYVNARASGTKPKAAVVAATTTDIPLATLAHPVDGVPLQDNDRVLVKDQTGSRHYQNGIWNAHPGAWTRSDDASTVDELVNATCFVLGGTNNATRTFLQVTPAPFGINFNDPPPFAEFSLFSTAIIAQAGPGLDQTGSIIFAVGTPNRIEVGTGIDIAHNYRGQNSIDTVGTISTGEWAGLVIDGSFGGTGVPNIGKHITLAGDFTTSLATGAPIGAYLTFALAGATTLVLPVVGTLATLNGEETFTNKHISGDQIDSGVVLTLFGGTGADNVIDARNNLLPDQTGHFQHFLMTDGHGHVSWVDPSTIG